MNRAAVAIGAAGLCCTLILVRSLAPNDAQRPTQQPAIAALLALDPGSAEFARAIAPRRFEFPRDHGPHEDFQTEWWYFSGHLSDDEGNPFGFQLTLFRFRNGAQLAASESAWRTPTLLLGHFAITDVAGAEFHHHERMSRAVPGIAGVNTVPLRCGSTTGRSRMSAIPATGACAPCMAAPPSSSNWYPPATSYCTVTGAYRKKAQTRATRPITTRSRASPPAAPSG